MNETIFNALAIIPVLIIAIVFHEVAHGYVALKLGDRTAQRMGRLSLNPIRHVDLFGTIIVPGMLMLAGGPAFGWAKPVPVIKNRLNNPRFGMMAVAAAGPASNLVMALIGAVALGLLLAMLGDNLGEASGIMAYVQLTLAYFISINIFLAVFNMIPLPPFDGSHIVQGLLPEAAAAQYQKLRPFGLPLLFVLLIGLPYLFPSLDLIDRLVIPPWAWLQGWYMEVAIAIAGR